MRIQRASTWEVCERVPGARTTPKKWYHYDPVMARVQGRPLHEGDVYTEPWMGKPVQNPGKRMFEAERRAKERSQGGKWLCWV